MYYIIALFILIYAIEVLELDMFKQKVTFSLNIVFLESTYFVLVPLRNNNWIIQYVIQITQNMNKPLLICRSRRSSIWHERNRASWTPEILEIHL